MASGRKQQIRGLALAASCLAFVLLLVQEDLLMTFFVGVIAAAILTLSLRNAPPKESAARELPFWLIAFAVNGYEAAQFYLYWRDSAKLRGIANSLHVPFRLLLPACCAALAVAALPFFVSALRWLWKGPETERLRRVNRRLSSAAFHRICLLLALAFLAIQVYYAFSCDIWYDECASMTFIGDGYWDMILVTAKDCHPPLYYLILKTVVDAARFALPAVDKLSVAKMVSIVPYAILLALCATKVRRQRGNFVAGHWAVCIVAMPNLMQYGVEVRMYSWGLLFVTLAYLWTDEIVRRGRASDWALFVFFSLCAAYTHYFALVAAAFCYLSLLIWYWTNDRAGLKRWFLASAITVVCYLPWLFVFLGQASRVSRDFWIPKITLSKVKQFVGFVYGNIGLVLLSALIGCALLYRIIRRTGGGAGMTSLRSPVWRLPLASWRWASSFPC